MQILTWEEIFQSMSKFLKEFISLYSVKVFQSPLKNYLVQCFNLIFEESAFLDRLCNWLDFQWVSVWILQWLTPSISQSAGQSTSEIKSHCNFTRKLLLWFKKQTITLTDFRWKHCTLIQRWNTGISLQGVQVFITTKLQVI